MLRGCVDNANYLKSGNQEKPDMILTLPVGLEPTCDPITLSTV